MRVTRQAQHYSMYIGTSATEDPGFKAGIGVVVEIVLPHAYTFHKKSTVMINLLFS